MTPALHRRGSARRPLLVLRRTVSGFLGLSLALVWFTTLACAVMFGAATAIVGIGVPVLVGALWATRTMADVECGLARALDGLEVHAT